MSGAAPPTGKGDGGRREVDPDRPAPRETVVPTLGSVGDVIVTDASSIEVQLRGPEPSPGRREPRHAPPSSPDGVSDPNAAAPAESPQPYPPAPSDRGAATPALAPEPPDEPASAAAPTGAAPPPEPAFAPPRPYPPPRPPTPADVALGAAWTQRVRVLGAAAPLGPLAAGVTLVAVLAAFFVGRACGGAAPGAAASTAATTSASAAGTSALVERAAEGEAAATAEIEARPEGSRSAPEVVALSFGTVARKRAEIADIEQKLGTQPELTRDPKILTTLRTYAVDPDVYREALRQIALLKGDVGPDLLFQLASGGKNATSALAQALLAASDVRSKAAPALALLFDLRDAASCEARKELLGRAIESADARSLSQLAQLRLKSGCGPQKRDDCNPCLRDDTRLEDAITAATRRPAPKL